MKTRNNEDSEGRSWRDLKLSEMRIRYIVESIVIVIL